MSDIFNVITEFLKGITGLLTALLGFITAFGLSNPKRIKWIIGLIRRLLRREISNPISPPPNRNKNVLSVVIFIISTVVAVVAILPTVPPTREQILTSIWKGKNVERWDKVIELSTKLLNDCEHDSENAQEKLIIDSVPEPKVGRVGADLSDTDVRTNFSNGLINDVATALYLRGEAYIHLGKDIEARSDLNKVLKYKHAVTLDDRTNEFWRTKDAAINKLYQLDKNKKL